MDVIRSGCTHFIQQRPLSMNKLTSLIIPSVRKLKIYRMQVSNLFCILMMVMVSLNALAEPLVAEEVPEVFEGGVEFYCPDQNITALASDINSYFNNLGITAEQFYQFKSDDRHLLQLTLKDQRHLTDTLDLINRREFDLKEELVQLPSNTKEPKYVITVSRKEIVLSLLQRGRVNKFSGRGCSMEALKDQVGIRQNIVAWTDSVDWIWPNGHSAKWNRKYWSHGDLNPLHPLHEALSDIFIHPTKYSFGCYTAAKIVVLQGIVDYYRRIKHDISTATLIEKRLVHDGIPLKHIEPGEMWFFESGFTPQDLNRQGKLLHLLKGIPSKNFVPRDWSYFLNTDQVTYRKTGYEGSNAIYLGRGKFDDFYNDNNHAYTYKEKLDEVYQWRNHVFSRSRDIAKITPLTPKEIDLLSKTPDNGGLQFDYRAVPYLFGFEELPEVN